MNAAVADPITTEVIRNFVISCAEDMNAALWRSAFSAIIYEGRDSAVALLDEKGNMLGQSTGVPARLTSGDVRSHWRSGARLRLRSPLQRGRVAPRAAEPLLL